MRAEMPPLITFMERLRAWNSKLLHLLLVSFGGVPFDGSFHGLRAGLCGAGASEQLARRCSGFGLEVVKFWLDHVQLTKEALPVPLLRGPPGTATRTRARSFENVLRNRTCWLLAESSTNFKWQPKDKKTLQAGARQPPEARAP